ncbi:MAG TPA: Rdx family protein [Vicinamibacterales bacterium]|nr:Rdx family protein [Vicinamibacterales bacterium]
MPRASSLGATISSELGIEPVLVRGERGVFDVLVGDKLIFSKHAEGRFPKDDEIVKAIQALR